MTNTTLRTCAHCNAKYSNVYTLKNSAYTYTKDTQYCSKSCASKSNIENNIGCILPDVGKDTLKKEALSFIQEKMNIAHLQKCALVSGEAVKLLRNMD